MGMDEVGVELTDLNSPDTVHPISHTPMEFGSFTTIPSNINNLFFFNLFLSSFMCIVTKILVIIINVASVNYKVVKNILIIQLHPHFFAPQIIVFYDIIPY